MSAAVQLARPRYEPQPGPQAAFASSAADVVIFGGAAGGGKSFALLYEAAKWVHLSGYRAILFRRTNPELVGGGGLWDEAQELYRALGGRPRAMPHLDFSFESGARIEFRHMQREADRFAHQGRQYAFVGFDEVTHFTEAQFWYLFGRLRSTCGVRPYLRATCNPDPDSFVYRLIGWWIGPDGYAIEERSGVVRWLVRRDEELRWYDTEAEALEANPPPPGVPADEAQRPVSVTFISSKLSDNPALLRADPTYRGKLQALSRVDRLRLLGDAGRGGNWRVREGRGMVLPREAFHVADKPPSRIVRTVRAWDKGARAPSPANPDPDWTRGVRVSLCEGGELWIDHVVSVRDRPAVVFRAMRQTAAGGDMIPPEGGDVAGRGGASRRWPGDGPAVTIGLWRDPGGAGIVDVETTAAVLQRFPIEVVLSASSPVEGAKVRKGRAKVEFAKVWSRILEGDGRQPGRVYVRAGQPWTEDLIGECDDFPEGPHDDYVDAISLAVQILLGSTGGDDLIAALATAAEGWNA